MTKMASLHWGSTRTGLDQTTAILWMAITSIWRCHLRTKAFQAGAQHRAKRKTSSESSFFRVRSLERTSFSLLVEFFPGLKNVYGFRVRKSFRRPHDGIQLMSFIQRYGSRLLEQWVQLVPVYNSSQTHHCEYL